MERSDGQARHTFLFEAPPRALRRGRTHGALRATPLLCCAGLFVVGACMVDRCSPPASADNDAAWVLMYTMPAPGTLGLEVALWRDGVILRASSEGDVGRSYQQGMLTDVDLQHIRDLIAAMGLAGSQCHGRVVWDARAEYLAIRTERSLLVWAHYPDSPDAVDLRITAIRKVLLSLAASDLHEVSIEALERVGFRWPGVLEGDASKREAPASEPRLKSGRARCP